jgi:hypothetical protein
MFSILQYTLRQYGPYVFIQSNDQDAVSNLWGEEHDVEMNLGRNTIMLILIF